MLIRWFARAMPGPTSVPPPSTSASDPNPVIMDVGPVAAFPSFSRGLSNQDRCIPNRNAFARCQKECAFFPGRSKAIAHDEIGIVDPFGDGQNLQIAGRKIADRIKVDHLAIGKKKRVDRSIGCGGKPDDLAGSIRPERTALITA